MEIIPDSDLILRDCGRAQFARSLGPVIITLERRPDRWNKIVSELSRVGISRMIKFRAVDGSTIPDEMLAALAHKDVLIGSTPTSHLQLTRPAIGCFVSHLQIWKRFAESSSDHILILEDDAVPSPNYTAANLEEILSSIPPAADLVLLGCAIMGDLADHVDNKFLRRVYYFNGTYAYLLTRKGCLNLLKHLFPLKSHIDHQISSALIEHHGSLHAYAAVPPLFNHDFSIRSDAYVPIENVHAADRHLGELITSARRVLHDNGKLTLGQR